MKRIILLIGAVAVLAASAALAKRAAPAPVVTVHDGHMEYRAPHSYMGCVEAWDSGKKKLVWRRQIYTVTYDADLEQDVQDVYITGISLKGDILTVTNERDSVYELNLKTLEVKVVKGAAVEKHD